MTLKKSLVFVLIIVAIIGGGFYFWQKKAPKIGEPVYVKPAYSETYRLVPEKISQSAAITIHLPEGVDKSDAQENIKFNPELEGQWLPSTKERETIFKPKEELKLNRYYSVSLTFSQSPTTTIEADFFAVENPELIAIFPKENSEAPENSEITIVFNRPMVPLTTLGYLESKDVPVEITPFTEGRFKWLTTRNLQFIPKERLQRSSHYKIEVKPGLVSMDNLELEGAEREFITRKLRYLNLTEGEIAYNQPISIYFNQPVDLESTKREISLLNIITGQRIPFIAEYFVESSKENSQKEKEKRGIFGAIDMNILLSKVKDSLTIDSDSQQEKNEGLKVDKSIIQVYNKADRFGREKFWDFENTYSLNIEKAYPIEGDIILNESRAVNIQVSGIIKNISAESERTPYAEPGFFDPQGKLWVDFYEDVDLEKSKIIAPKLKEIGYGEKCKQEMISSSLECEKIIDRKRVYLTFQEKAIGFSERLTITFEKLINMEGLSIIEDPIAEYITSFPEFKVLKTFPADNSSGASLTELIICSNSPILVPAKEEYDNYFKANLDYELNYWGSSFRITSDSQYYKCKPGEFQTTIGYGLIPLADYSLELNLEDVFFQKAIYSLKFTTGPMPSGHLTFYHFQRQYNVTSLKKTKLTYALRNMGFVNMEICELSALDFLYYIEQRPSYYEPSSSITGCQQIIRKRIELPERYWLKNYFQVDINDYFEEPIGHYILTFSHPNYTGYYWDSSARVSRQVPVYERTYLTVTNLAVAEKRIQAQYATYGQNEPLGAEQLSGLYNLYWVSFLSNLEAVQDAKIDLYRKSPAGKELTLILAGSELTNNQGLAFTDVIYDLKGAIITAGKDSTIIPSRESRLTYVSSAFSGQRIYLYTEKPIYRPGQEVFIKGIHRLGYDGNYEIQLSKQLNLQIYNSKNDEVFSKMLNVNGFGTFDTKFILDKKAPLGMYRACVDGFDCVYFDVQEYVPSAFEVQLQADKEEYISKDTVQIDIEANYYFGVPLEGGEVSYTLSSQNYYFDKYTDGYFNFGSRWYYWSSQPYGDRFILRGKTSLDENGKAKISQLLDFEQLFKDREDRKSKIIVVNVTVENPQGRSVSAQKSFLCHAGEFYLGVRADKSFLAKNEKFNIKVKSVDTEGEEVKVEDIALNLYKIEWVKSKRLGPDGGYHYTWEKKRDLVADDRFATNKKGDFGKELKIAEEGSYEMEVAAKDKRGNSIWSTYNLYVYGKAAVSWKPTEDAGLEIETEKAELNVGEKASIIVKSPYPKAKALIAVERGRIFDYQIKEIEGNLYNYQFEIKEEYIPNVFVSVLLLSSTPEIKFGNVEFKINTARKELDIEVKSNKTYYLPGEEVILDITAKDWQKKPVPAELSIAVVDLSILALKGNPKKNPLIFFYKGFPLTVSTASNIKDILEEVEVATKGGGGGVEELARKKRGLFKETAFWQAVVETDQAGKAQVKFTLPDNLTTWQTETLGLTKDTKLGVDYQEFITRKELMVVPLRPRFVVPGDVFYIGGKIFNQTEEKQKLDVGFNSQTLILEENKEKENITIEAGKTATVYFKVKAPQQLGEGSHVFVLSAKSKSLEDTVEQSIAITSNDTYEVAATANWTTDKASQEYVFLPDNILRDKGELSIKSSATLAVFLSDALNYLLGYSYGCSEQIASRLGSIAIIQKGLNLPNMADKFKLGKLEYEGREYTISEIVEIGLAEIYNSQQFDGGFSYWQGGKSDFHLTLHMVDTLYNLSLAGFEVSQNSLQRASNYLYKEITTDEELHRDNNTLILASYTLFRLPQFTNNQILKQRLQQIINNDLILKEQISNSALAYLAIAVAKEFDAGLRNKVFEVLDNRLALDSRGAFLESGNNVIWRYYETPIKNTALYLRAQVAGRRDNPIIDKVVRWLLRSRAKDGAWGSTNNTLTVIEAFTDFLQWKRETESDFDLEIFVNDKAEAMFSFNPETILDQFKKEFSLEKLQFNKNNTIKFLKTEHNNLPNNLYYGLALKYYLPADQIPPRDEGFSLSREFYTLEDIENKNPLREAQVGDVLRGHLQITVPKSRNFAAVEDYIPAGFEIVNLNLATEQKSLSLQEKELKGRELNPGFQEIRDDRLFLFKEKLEPGLYEFDYYVRALIKGRFVHLPAKVSEMYFPENFGRTDGRYFEVK